MKNKYYTFRIITRFLFAHNVSALIFTKAGFPSP